MPSTGWSKRWNKITMERLEVVRDNAIFPAPYPSLCLSRSESSSWIDA